MGLTDFIDDAPCKSADPWLFDQHQIDLALPALQYCKRCIFWENCDELVKPRASFYDGVSAGRVWRNGRVLAKLDTTSHNRLLVGEETFFEDAVEFRGGELLGD